MLQQLTQQAENGDLAAQFRLALMYDKGEGVPRNLVVRRIIIIWRHSKAMTRRNIV